MASGSQNMTTDKARQASYLDTPSEFGYTTDQYGNLICKNIDSETICFFHLDNNAKTFSLRYYWDTGDVWIPGRVGIGYNPTTSGNTYKLYVDGDVLATTFVGDLNGNADTATIWQTARTLTVGATGKSVNGSANISWSMDEIMGSSDSSKFYRGDKTWSNTIVGSFNASSSGSNRANINMVSVADVPNDFYLGNNNANKWSITSRASNESYNLNVYSTASGIGYSTRWEYSTGKFIMLHGAEISDGGLEIKGHIAGDTGTTGHGLYSGGAYHNAYNNIILQGDATTGSSGIAFVSSKGTTSINQPSDRAFIQFHAYGVTTYTAEGTAPTLATSGEANVLVIGVGNDAADQVRLQTPGQTGLLHQMGANAYVIPDTGNTTGTVGGTEQPIYSNGGVLTSTSYALKATVNNSTAGYMAHYSGDRAVSGTSYARMIDGCLNLYPANSNYREGMRIHPISGWSDITLMGNTNTNTSGIAATDWFIGNNSGTFYITHAGSSSSTTGYIKASTENSAGYWQLYQRVGVNGISNTYNFYVNGTSYFNGSILLKANQYRADGVGLNANNSDIFNVNSISFNDVADAFNEGIMFYRSAGVWECLAANSSGFFIRQGTDGTPALNAANANGTLFASSVWGDKTRICSNWIGFYKDTGTDTTRYGYIQANVDRMYFRKENGVSTYHFDFNGHIYTSGSMYLTSANAFYGTLGSFSSTAQSDVGGLTWQNHDSGPSTTVNANDGPTSAWWYILRNRHTNTSNNYYTDLAIPFNANTIYYKRIGGGTIQNTASVSNGWIAVLDQLNYTTWTVTKTGSGASGTWGINITGNADQLDGYHASGLWRSDGATWNGNANVTCNATANGQEWSFDLNAGSYTGTYWHVWSTKNSASILQCYTDDRRVNIPVRLDTGWLRVVNDSSNTSDDALVYIQNQTANDWAVKIVKGGKDYGIRVDSLDQSNAIWTNGYIRARAVWANQGSNGERQVGTDSSTSGTIYLWSNTTEKGIYSGSGYRTGYIIRCTSSATTFYGALSGNADTATNADKLDGYHESAFLRYSGWWTSGNGLSLDNANGMVFAYNNHGHPTNWGVVATFDYQKDSNYRLQLAGGGYDNTLWFRNRSSDRNGWYTGWQRVVTNSGSWSISVTGSAGSVAWTGVTGKAMSFGSYTCTSASVSVPANGAIHADVGDGTPTSGWTAVPSIVVGFSVSDNHVVPRSIGPNGGTLRNLTSSARSVTLTLYRFQYKFS